MRNSPEREEAVTSGTQVHWIPGPFGGWLVGPISVVVGTILSIIALPTVPSSLFSVELDLLGVSVAIFGTLRLGTSRRIVRNRRVGFTQSGLILDLGLGKISVGWSDVRLDPEPVVLIRSRLSPPSLANERWFPYRLTWRQATEVGHYLGERQFAGTTSRP
jgi:hypothetical protein